MRTPGHRVVALLRPPQVSLEGTETEKIQEWHYGIEGDGNRKLREFCDQARAAVEEVAECLDLRPHVLDCQLHDHSGGQVLTVLSRKRHRRITGADMFMTVDPDPRQLAYVVRSAQTEPLATAVIGYTSRQRFDLLLGLLQATDVPLAVGDASEMGLPKIFPLHVDTKSDDTTAAMLSAMRRALLFPKNPPAPCLRPMFPGTGIMMPAKGESDQALRRELVEQRTDDKDAQAREEFIRRKSLDLGLM